MTTLEKLKALADMNVLAALMPTRTWGGEMDTELIIGLAVLNPENLACMMTIAAVVTTLDPRASMNERLHERLRSLLPKELTDGDDSPPAPVGHA